MKLKRYPFLLVWAVLCYATPVFSQSCDCTSKLDFIAENLQANYAGYPDKVNSHTQTIYNRLLDSLHSRSKVTQDDFGCFRLAQRLIQFFGDKHAAVYYAQPPAGLPAEKVRSYYQPVQRSLMDSVAIITALQKSKDPAALEGIYHTDDMSYRLAILRNKKRNRYEAIVLSTTSEYWNAGDIKFIIQPEGSEYTVFYYAGMHNPSITTVKQKGAILQFNYSAVRWIREGEHGNTAIASIAKFSNEFEFSRLSDKTLLLRAPDFFRQNKKQLDSIIGANWSLIQSTPNLIIDIRSSGGGQDFVYDTLLALAYTNEILQYPVLYRASPDNIRLYDSLGAKKIAADMRAVTGGFLHRPISNIKKDRVYAYPKQVAVLSDRLVGSSGEQFLLSMKQSGKVTIIGENSSGTLDYGEPLRIKVPCTEWILQRPTSKHARLPEYPVDLQGIVPDVYVPAYEKDWIDFTKRLMEKRN